MRVAAQPTFTRYIFELPELTGVTAERGKDRLTLSFAKPLRFDLSDAKLAAAKAVAAVDAGGNGDTAEVQFKLSQQADIRTFREDSNYVVDVSPIDANAPRLPPSSASPARSPIAAPQTVPAQGRAEAAANVETGGATPPQSAPAAAADQPKRRQPRRPQQPARRAPAARRRAIRTARSTAELRRQGDNLRLFFPFAAPTPAAVFQRADTLWLVFDTKAAIDIGVLSNDQSKTIRSAAVTREDDAQVVRLKLERPRLTSVEPQDAGWLVTIGEAMAGATKPLVVARNIVGPGRTSITIPFDEPQQGALADRCRRRRPASGRHRLGPDARPDQEPGLRRSARARQRPGHRHAAVRRRSQGRAVGRQGAAGAARAG